MILQTSTDDENKVSFMTILSDNLKTNYSQMKRITQALIILRAMVGNFSMAQSSNSLIFKPKDKIIAEEKLKQFAAKSDLPIADLIVEVGLSFLETPYVIASLENGLEERMVINLREMDCTTFAENCLALSRVIKSGKTDFDTYVLELERIRYRDGIRNQYPSRLHYFSEWISDNTKKGIVDGTPNKNGEKSDKPINYMSTHPASYPVLKEHPELIPSIAEQEKALSKTGFMYFPKNDIPNLHQHLKHGDIIALTSSIAGVDVNHVGIILKKGSEFHLLHAPLSGKKVLVSDGPIADFLKPESKNSGIMIARPVF
jgi:hypothetical protein